MKIATGKMLLGKVMGAQVQLNTANHHQRVMMKISMTLKVKHQRMVHLMSTMILNFTQQKKTVQGGEVKEQMMAALLPQMMTVVDENSHVS
mmetsp:Transcript_77860/g.178213  ORF Transcript_77860/g.178213 Transcript_77860/m.178213 type:complete len:91 (+) Transcript_77860:311-583(+)